MKKPKCEVKTPVFCNGIGVKNIIDPSRPGDHGGNLSYRCCLGCRVFLRLNATDAEAKGMSKGNTEELAAVVLEMIVNHGPWAVLWEVTQLLKPAFLALEAEAKKAKPKKAK